MQVVLAIIFVLYATGICAGLVVSATLFTNLKKKYPKYYKLIGEPVTFPNAYNPNSAPFSRGFTAQGFWLSVLCKGVPVNFPKDRKLRKLVTFIRLDLSVLLVLLVVTTQRYNP